MPLTDTVWPKAFTRAISGKAVAFSLVASSVIAAAQSTAVARYRHATSYATLCGVSRWPVKTLADRGASSLPTTASATTIAALSRLPRPLNAAQAQRRLAPVETTLWRTRALLQGYELEFDGDIHLLLRDPHTSTPMIGEIPSPSCSPPQYGGAFARARYVVQTLGHHSAQRRRIWWLDYRGERMPLIQVWGYGFWDDEHGQRGAAANYVELHPVVQVAANASTTISPVHRNR